jgi:hypothetical protein
MLVPNSLLEIDGFDTTKMVAYVLRDAFMSGHHEHFQECAEFLPLRNRGLVRSP